MPYKNATNNLKNRKPIITNNGVALGRVAIKGSCRFFEL
jgi:hypothetical protein